MAESQPVPDRSKPAEAERPARSLADLPSDELLAYGRELGLHLAEDVPQGELVRRVREREELLGRLDHAAMLDIARWARLPVRQSASKEQLARQIATVEKMDFANLSERGLVTLALLRGATAAPGEGRDVIVKRLKKTESMGGWVRRKGRGMVAKMLSHYLDSPQGASDDYQFLPEDRNTRPASLHDEIMDRGVMSSLANRLRGAADDYVRAKMDEIEQRIDRKLDEIDRRLAEWRDREVANRIKILRITVMVSVLVALLSLAYKYVGGQLSGKPPTAASSTQH